MIQRTATETIGFARPPMEIVTALKVEERALALRGGLVLGARLLAVLIAIGAVSCLGPLGPLAREASFAWIDASRWLLAAVLLGWTALRLYLFAGVIDAETRNAAANVSAYIQEWQDATLAAYTGARGLVETRSYTETDLRVSNPAQFIAAAVAVFLAARRGQKAWTVERLREGLYLNDSGGATFLGRFTEDEALAFAQALASARVIEGRRPKVAGQLADVTAEQYLERIVPLARKLGGRAAYAGGEEE